MYKRLLCALCFALVLLFVVAMVYLLISYNQSKSQEVKDPPSISIYLVDLHNNSRDRISQGADKTVVIDRVERGLSYIGEKVKRKLLLFVCSASFPNQWKYNGFGALQGKVHFQRDVPDFQDVAATYQSTIELSEISEFITGYYECVGFNKSDPVSRIYVFAPDKKNNTFIIKHEEEIEVRMYEPFVIPCPVSDPQANISLIRLILPYENGVMAEVDLKNKNSFDPKVGFRFSSIMDVDNDSSPGWGTYICQDENGRYSDIVKVVKPLATIASYSIEKMTNRNENQSSVRVTCICQEEVYFEFYNFVSRKHRKVKQLDDDSRSIRVRIHDEDFTNTSIINCVTKIGYRVLFSWKFKENGVFVNSSSDIIIDYDETTKNFACCSKSNENPKLKLLSCNTEAECQFQFNDLKTNSYKNLELIANLTKQTNETCTTINAERFSQGLLQCSMDKYAKQIYFYIDPESGKRRKKEPPQDGPDFIVKLEQKYTKILPSLGKQIRFDCSAPRFFAAQGFQWELKKISGASEYRKSNGVENSLKDLKEWIDFTLRDQQVFKIICNAPAIGSSQFLTNSAAVNYTVFSAKNNL